MTDINRRKFIKMSVGAGAALNFLPPLIRKALAVDAHNPSKGIQDVQHIVILMQENRSFDHYFGTMRGVPQVSWILPSQRNYEHPSGPSSPNRGGDFTHQVLAAITANPDVWSKTVFFLTFDENDGLLDHLPAPAVPSCNADGTLAEKLRSTLPECTSITIKAQRHFRIRSWKRVSRRAGR